MKIEDIILCPACKSKLNIAEQNYICSNCSTSYKIISNIPVLLSEETQKNIQSLEKYFNNKYAESKDPWGYESSAAEKMKYDFVINLIRKINPDLKSILDVGCSFGYLSNKLSLISENVTGLDVSIHALTNAKEKYHRDNLNFICASAANIPLKDNAFEIVTLCDGLNGMDLTGAARDNAVKESYRVLKRNGYALFTDYLKPSQFEDYINYINKSEYKIKEVIYLNDRFWYKLKYAGHSFRNNSFFKKILSSISIGKALSIISSLFGKRGSNHICVVAQKSE